MNEGSTYQYPSSHNGQDFCIFGKQGILAKDVKDAPKIKVNKTPIQNPICKENKHNQYHAYSDIGPNHREVT